MKTMEVVSQNVDDSPSKKQKRTHDQSPNVAISWFDQSVPGKYLFERHLSLYDVDVNSWGLYIPKAEAEKHFPLKGTEGAYSKEEKLLITDDKNRDWEMGFSCFPMQLYLIRTQWKKFVVEHRLETNDLIVFYKPHHPKSTYHYLVRCVKRK